MEQMNGDNVSYLQNIQYIYTKRSVLFLKIYLIVLFFLTRKPLEILYLPDRPFQNEIESQY